MPAKIQPAMTSFSDGLFRRQPVLSDNPVFIIYNYLFGLNPEKPLLGSGQLSIIIIIIVIKLLLLLLLLYIIILLCCH